MAPWDRFLAHLCLYLTPWHRTTLQYSDFMSELLMPALQEVIVASHEDSTHELMCLVANLGLMQSRQPSSLTRRG